jgi:hypothetical protein
MVDEHKRYDLWMKKQGKNNTRENVILKGLVEFYVHSSKRIFAKSI